jgi:hypothetical protein
MTRPNEAAVGSIQAGRGFWSFDGCFLRFAKKTPIETPKNLACLSFYLR